MRFESKKLKWFAAVTAGCFIVDQLTKQIVVHELSLGEHRNLIAGIGITRSYNQGVAFSLFANHSWLVTSLLAVCMLALVVFLALYLQNQLPTLSWVGAIVGGALGNLVDRVLHQGVIDFLDIWFWPTFNIADVAIVVGALGVAYQMFQLHTQRTSA